MATNKGKEVTSQRNRDTGMRRQERVLEGPEKEARQDEKNKNTTGQ